MPLGPTRPSEEHARLLDELQRFPEREEELIRHYLAHSVDWSAVGQSLVAKICRAARVSSADIIARGDTAEDIAARAIHKALTRQRRWDPRRGDLAMWLFWVAKSEFSHLIGGRTAADVPIDIDEELRRLERRVEDVTVEKQVDESLIDKELVARAFAVVRREGDPALVVLLDAAFVRGTLHPSVLAEEIGVDRTTVRNNVRRLRRVIVRDMGDDYLAAEGQ